MYAMCNKYVRFKFIVEHYTIEMSENCYFSHNGYLAFIFRDTQIPFQNPIQLPKENIYIQQQYVG